VSLWEPPQSIHVLDGLVALHSSSAVSCCIILDCGIQHNLHMLGHCGSLLLATLICKASRSSSTLMIWLIKSNFYKYTQKK